MISVSLVYTFLFALTIIHLVQKLGSRLLKLHYFRRNQPNNKEGIQIGRYSSFPISLPLLEGLYSVYQARKNGVNTLLHWANRVGEAPLVELPIGPFNTILFKDARLSQKILSSSNPGHLNRPKSIYHRIMVDMLTKGLLCTEYEVWNHQRKILSRAFTYRTFQSYIKVINRHNKEMASVLWKMAEENEGIIQGQQVQETVHMNVLKITLEFIFGSVFIDESDTIQFSKNFLEYKEIALYRFLRPELYIPPVWWLHPKSRRVKELSENVNHFMAKVNTHYQKKFKEGNANKDEDEEERCLVEEMVKHNASPEEIHCEIGTFLAAGHETVSTAMKLILQHLACHPKFQMCCREEVDKVLGPYDPDPELNRDLSIDDLSKLEFLERFILESFRIAPTVPVLARELTSPLKLDEKLTLEKGKIVLLSPWIIHHNPVYYPSPDIFDPDRFLPEEVAKREPGTFFPFAGGLRNCIGKRFAMLELKASLARILRHFEIHSEDGMFDVLLHFEATLRPIREFRISFKKRTC